MERTPIHSDVFYEPEHECDASSDSDVFDDAAEDTVSERKIRDLSPDHVPCEPLELPLNETGLKITVAIVRMPIEDFVARLAHSVTQLASAAMLDEGMGDDGCPKIEKNFHAIAANVNFRCYKNCSTLAVCQLLGYCTLYSWIPPGCQGAAQS